MTGTIAALYQHPIKGFTPQRIGRAQLTAGQCFPGDRLFAVEDGPSGFDPAAPQWTPKRNFTVLAKTAELALARTACDPASGRLEARAPGAPPLTADLAEPEGKTAFAAWLSGFFGGAVRGPLKVVEGPGHRFLDHPQGHVSIVNLASVRDFEARLGVPVDPLRFRANLYVEGWAAWEENGWTDRELVLGGAEARVFMPITRCAAPEVDPASGRRDIEVTSRLHEFYGHLLCGVYVQITHDGEVAEGSPAGLASP